MSKTSYGLICIMLAALIYMGAVRIYQWYERKTVQWEEERLETEGAFSFQHVPVSLAAPQAEPMPGPVLFSTATAIFLEDAPLSPAQEEKQAHETIQSILKDFEQEPPVAEFNRELASVTNGQATDISALSDANLAQLLEKDPQIKAVISKHMQNPQFAELIEQIFSNPQFVESVRRLQGPSSVQPVKKTE
ncbi:MAG: hypothetical protein IKO35_03975 [Elusimicrobiaceae bacterium]|nr:hypothetical protein [Elusimicrobiaceae bacterium]